MNRLNHKIYYYLFIVIILIDGITGIIISFLSSCNSKYLGSLQWFKLAFVMEVVIAVMYFLCVKRSIKMNVLSYVFLFFCAFGMIVGAINHQYNSKYMVHIFSYLMPVIMMGFAHYFYCEYRQNTKLRIFMQKMVIVGLIIYVCAVAAFRLVSIFGNVRYSALGAAWGMYAQPFFMSGDSIICILWGYIALAANAISGKRSILVGAILSWVMCLLFVNKKKRVLLTQWLLMFLSFFCVVALIFRTDVFSRIITTLSNIFGDGADLYLATSGRNYEIELIIEYLNQQPLMWVTGIGFGGKVWIQELYRHYSHFSPLGYVMTGGIFASIMIYGILCWKVVKGMVYGIKGYLKEWEKPYVILLANAIVASLFGAVLNSTPIWWFFIGMAFAILDKRQYQFDAENVN